MVFGCTGYCETTRLLPYWSRQDSLTIRPSAITRQSDIAAAQVRFFDPLGHEYCSNSQCTFKMVRCSIRRSSTFRRQRLKSAVEFSLTMRCGLAAHLQFCGTTGVMDQSDSGVNFMSALCKG